MGRTPSVGWVPYTHINQNFKGAVVGVPALAGGGLLDLDPQRTAHLSQVGDLLQIARPPIVGAQRPLRLQRLRHHLLDQLAAVELRRSGEPNRRWVRRVMRGVGIWLLQPVRPRASSAWIYVLCPRN